MAAKIPQPSVAWQRRPFGRGNWIHCDQGDIPAYQKLGDQIRNLYAIPPLELTDELVEVAARAACEDLGLHADDDASIGVGRVWEIEAVTQRKVLEAVFAAMAKGQAGG